MKDQEKKRAQAALKYMVKVTTLPQEDADTISKSIDAGLLSPQEEKEILSLTEQVESIVLGARVLMQ